MQGTSRRAAPEGKAPPSQRHGHSGLSCQQLSVSVELARPVLEGKGKVLPLVEGYRPGGKLIR